MAVLKSKKFLAMLSTVYTLRKQRERREKDKAVKQRKRRFWVRDIFKNKNSSEYDGIVQELRLKDLEFHYRYLRMSKERFEFISL